MASPAPIPPAELRGGRVVHNVARAYIDGLERDRAQLRELEERYDKLVWETIQISAYAKALYLAATALRNNAMNGSRVDWDRVDDLLEADRRTYHEVWSCECGHHRYDHDENGRCEYLACRHICGKEQ